MNSSINITRGVKRYELTKHLGNVNVVLTDKRVPVCNADTVTYYTADVVSASDYSPFGAPLVGRSYTAPNSDYRFHFNGKEKDNDTYSEGNAYDFGARIQDSRLGKWMSVDPMYTFAIGISPFSYGLNNPISNIDIEGAFVIDSKDPNAPLIRRYVEAARKALEDPFIREIFKQHSGLTEDDIIEIFTEGKGPALTIGKTSNVNWEAEFDGHGSNISFKEMGTYRLDIIKKDKITLNKDVFLQFKQLTTNNMKAHHSFFVAIIILHELVHFGDLRTDGKKNNNIDYSKVFKSNEIKDLQDISRTYSFSYEFQNGIEPGKAFEYNLAGWEILRSNIKSMFKNYQKSSEKDKKEKKDKKDSTPRLSPRFL